MVSFNPNWSKHGESFRLDFKSMIQFDMFSAQGTPAVLDYSGTTQSGGHVMGIAHKHEGFEGKILLDPVLQWTLPDSFTLTEAASLPSAYLMVCSDH